MGWRAAERRERALRALEGPLSPAAALDAAFELHDVFAAASSRPDIVRAREVADARATWRKLRLCLPCHPPIPH
jgi:hypothetical protein